MNTCVGGSVQVKPSTARLHNKVGRSNCVSLHTTIPRTTYNVNSIPYIGRRTTYYQVHRAVLTCIGFESACHYHRLGKVLSVLLLHNELTMIDIDDTVTVRTNCVITDTTVRRVIPANAALVAAK